MRSAKVMGLLALLAGCAPSEAEVREDFSAFIRAHSSCEQDEDCALIMPGCPLGCSVALQASAASEGMRLARELIEDYESSGAACDYDCRATCGASCAEKVCTTQFADPSCPAE